MYAGWCNQFTTFPPAPSSLDAWLPCLAFTDSVVEWLTEFTGVILCCFTLSVTVARLSIFTDVSLIIQEGSFNPFSVQGYSLFSVCDRPAGSMWLADRTIWMAAALWLWLLAFIEWSYRHWGAVKDWDSPRSYKGKNHDHNTETETLPLVSWLQLLSGFRTPRSKKLHWRSLITDIE